VPWHLDTTVTVSQGRIEKFLAKASPEEMSRWTAALDDLWTGAIENHPDAFAKYVSAMDETSPNPGLAGRAIRQLCESYAKR
jgi:hypothetical protein